MKKQLLILFSFVFFGTSVFAQGITNKGAVITVSSGTYLVVDNNGGYFNESDGSNHGQIDLDGIFQIEGDFQNNVTDASQHVFTNVGTDGEVIFAGSGTQHILNATDNAYIDFEKVTVNSGSTTLLDAGSAATMNGALTINGTFTSKTPLNEGPSGSIITNSTIGGTGDVNLERYFTVENRWMYIAVPIANQTSTPLIDTPYPGYVNPNFYTYNETIDGDDPANTNYSNWDDFTGTWVNVGTGASLDKGVGYIWNAYNASDVNVTFFSSTPSDIYTGSDNVTVTYTDNDDGGGYGEYYDGWNLVGNIFPSAIDWDQLSKTASMDNVAYYFDGDAGNYIYYDAGGTVYQGSGQILNNTGSSQYIPAYQSFIVHLSHAGSGDVSETFTLANSARVHNNQVMYKDNEKGDYDFQYLKLRTENDNYFDETIVRFIDGTQDEFNGKEDAFKMFSNVPDVPMLYSLTINSNEYPLAINSLPLEDIGTSIPLGFKTTNSGTYNIKVTEFNFDAGTDVKLIDTYENTETDLYEGTEYTFSFDGGEVRDRFYLFSAISGVDNPEEGEDMLFSSDVWSNENKLYIA
ncbi:MAG: hypothetical protein J7K64_01760, partial [Bacteroidales bacterium]|nr:hypothetical protein [Bacteroidales bacterium]